MKSKLSTIKEAKKSSRQEKKKIRMSQSAPEPEKKNPKYYGYGKLQLPVEVLQELKTIKLAYQIAWKDKDGNLPRLTYGDLMGRLITGAKRNDPEIVPCLADAKAVFGDEKLYLQNKTKSELNDVVKRSTKKAVDELADRAEANGTNLKKEAMKEQKAVKAEMTRQREETKQTIKAQKAAVEKKEEAKPTKESIYMIDYDFTEFSEFFNSENEEDIDLDKIIEEANEETKESKSKSKIL